MFVYNQTNFRGPQGKVYHVAIETKILVHKKYARVSVSKKNKRPACIKKDKANYIS